MLSGGYDLFVAVTKTLILGILVLIASPFAEKKPDWARPVSPKSRRVVVLLHDANQRHFIWSFMVQFMLHALPDTDAVYAPFFDHRDPLTALAGHVLGEIEPYIKKNNLELVVVGYSNGGRIALHLEQMLPGHTYILIGSPIKGTRWLDLLPEWILRLRLDTYLIQEMRLHRFVPHDQSNIICFAADWDEMVWPSSCCAPGNMVPKVLPGNTHGTLSFNDEVLQCIKSPPKKLDCGHF